MPTIKIAFTSCARYKPGQAQTGWAEIDATDPDYLFLLGDQIYMDFGLWPFSAEYRGKPKGYSVDKFADTMRQKYQRQWSEPNFSRLVSKMRAKGGFFGVWDDHDFAWNNAYGCDGTLPKEVNMAGKKAVARVLFHEFMACATHPPEIYGAHDTTLARFIFLDNRSYATPPQVEDAVLMGAAQMAFLTEQLHHPRPYTLICGGLSLLHSSECWAKYPSEFAQFQRLVAQRPGVLYLGGDIHKNAFLAPKPDARPPCYEIISSGLCVNYLGLPFEFDRRRNWTLLELSESEVRISQHDKHGSSNYRIDARSWQSQSLGRG